MIQDALLEFATANDVTSTEASDVVPLGSQQQIGAGEPMAVLFSITTAADSSSGNETYNFQLQTSDTEVFTVADTIGSVAIPAADLVAGYKFWVGIPGRNKEFLRIRVETGGTSPSVSYSAVLTPQQAIDTASYTFYKVGDTFL